MRPEYGAEQCVTGMTYTANQDSASKINGWPGERLNVVPVYSTAPLPQMVLLTLDVV